MKLQDLIEAEVEVDGNKVYKIQNRYQSTITKNKLSPMKKTQFYVDANGSVGSTNMAAIRQVINYLKATNRFKYIKNLDSKSPDIQFKTNGDAIVNFDGGGSIVIPEKKYMDTPLTARKFFK